MLRNHPSSCLTANYPPTGSSQLSTSTGGGVVAAPSATVADWMTVGPTNNMMKKSSVVAAMIRVCPVREIKC